MVKYSKDLKTVYELAEKEVPPWLREFTVILSRLNNNHILLFNKQLAALDVTIAIRAILYVLVKNGGKMMQKDFISEIPVTKQAITKILNIMMKKQYIKKMISDRDRRNTKIYITEKGLTKLEKSVHLSSDFNRKIQCRLGEKKGIEITKYLKDLNTLYEQEISHLNSK